MKRKLLWFLIITILAGGIYFLLRKENLFTYFTFDFNGQGDKISEDANKNKTNEVGTGNILSEYKAELGTQLTRGLVHGQSLVNQVSEDAQGKVAEIVAKTKEQALPRALDFVRGGFNNAVAFVGNSLGIESGGDGANPIADPASIIRYSTKVNESIYFSIKNSQSEAGKFQYLVDWGDNFKENGEVDKGMTKTVSHFWNKEGEYQIQFKITADVGVVDYKNYIVVLK